MDLIYFTERQDRADGVNAGRSLTLHMPSVGIQLVKRGSLH